MRYTNILVYTKKHRLGLPFHKVTPLVTTIHYNPFGYVWWWQVCRLYEVIRCSCHVRGGSRLTSHEGVYGFRTIVNTELGNHVQEIRERQWLI